MTWVALIFVLTASSSLANPNGYPPPPGPYRVGPAATIPPTSPSPQRTIRQPLQTTDDEAETPLDAKILFGRPHQSAAEAPPPQRPVQMDNLRPAAPSPPAASVFRPTYETSQ